MEILLQTYFKRCVLVVCVPKEVADTKKGEISSPLKFICVLYLFQKDEKYSQDETNESNYMIPLNRFPFE